MNTGVHKHCMLLELAYDLENHLIGLILWQNLEKQIKTQLQNVENNYTRQKLQQGVLPQVLYNSCKL